MRPDRDKVRDDQWEFQFTHPVWGATVHNYAINGKLKFQFTHPVWGATSKYVTKQFRNVVSIHAPRVGCDKAGAKEAAKGAVFQFTHPVWGATGVAGFK